MFTKCSQNSLSPAGVNLSVTILTMSSYHENLFFRSFTANCHSILKQPFPVLLRPENSSDKTLEE